jgi:hypothetical protein
LPGQLGEPEGVLGAKNGYEAKSMILQQFKVTVWLPYSFGIPSRSLLFTGAGKFSRHLEVLRGAQIAATQRSVDQLETGTAERRNSETGAPVFAFWRYPSSCMAFKASVTARKNDRPQRRSLGRAVRASGL